MTTHRHCQLQNLHRDLEGLRQTILYISVRRGESGLSEAEEDAAERPVVGGCHHCVCSRSLVAAGANASSWTFSLNPIWPS